MFRERWLTFEDALKRGRALYEVTRVSKEVPETIYTDSDMLEQYGWTEFAGEGDGPLDGRMGQALYPGRTRTSNMYGFFNLQSEPENNIQITLDHNRPSRPNGDALYPPTRGTYRCVYNPRAIIQLDVSGPDDRGLFRRPPVRDDDVVPLKHLSDVLFLQWQKFCSDRGFATSDLSYILVMSISNKSTISVLAEALRKTDETLRPIDPMSASGVPATFAIDSDEAQAILGTDNGVGVHWFLAQHKAQMAGKVVTHVAVFSNLDQDIVSTMYHLCFYLGPRPWED